MNFKIGQKVVCIDGEGWIIEPGTGSMNCDREPKTGEIFTISGISVYKGVIYLALKELMHDEYDINRTYPF